MVEVIPVGAGVVLEEGVGDEVETDVETRPEALDRSWDMQPPSMSIATRTGRRILGRIGRNVARSSDLASR